MNRLACNRLTYANSRAYEMPMDIQAFVNQRTNGLFVISESNEEDEEDLEAPDSHATMQVNPTTSFNEATMILMSSDDDDNHRMPDQSVTDKENDKSNDRLCGAIAFLLIVLLICCSVLYGLYNQRK